MTLPANFHINRPKFSPKLLPEMRRLWEECPELSAHAIGVLLGVTKNTVIGQASRQGWKPRKQQTDEPPIRVRVASGKRVKVANLDPVARFIAERGVTRCPTAFAAPSQQAMLPAAEVRARLGKLQLHETVPLRNKPTGSKHWRSVKPIGAPAP